MKFLGIGGTVTRAGVLLFLLGTGIAANAEICPIPEWIPWLKFIGKIIEGLGMGAGGIGIAREIERQ